MLHVLPIADCFRPSAPFAYPQHQRGPLVEEFVHRHLAEHPVGVAGPWVYLPAYWTNYAAQMSLLGRWKRAAARRRMQRLLSSLPEGYQWVTVSQHDDGLLQRGMYEPSAPILEFSAGGAGDIPIPLLCDEHRPVLCERNIRASFVGALRPARGEYPCREAMARALAERSEYAIRDVPGYWGVPDRAAAARQTAEFVELMCRSVFALCPRGYGKTSFRLYEAMALGAIPVYIYDEPWLPYAELIDWQEICVLVPLARIDYLHDILADISAARVDAMRRRIRELHDDYFTLPAVARQVVRSIEAADLVARTKSPSYGEAA
jgi:hypothetical protein